MELFDDAWQRRRYDRLIERAQQHHDCEGSQDCALVSGRHSRISHENLDV
jgi:hypothetical protein